MSKQTESKRMKEIVELIEKKNIFEYADLIEILMDGGEVTSGLFEVAIMEKNVSFFSEYLDSRRRIAGKV